MTALKAATKKKISESKKGKNPGNWKRDTSGLQAYAIEKKKAKVEGNARIKAAHKPPAYSDPVLMAYRAADYFYRQDQEERPYTESGLCVALLIDPASLARYASGEKDYIAFENILSREGTAADKIVASYRCKQEIQPYYYYLIGLNPNESDLIVTHDCENGLLFSDIIKKARLLITESREERLSKRGSVADIFTLKAREGWQDEKVTVHRMEIATAEEAEEAIKLLK